MVGEFVQHDVFAVCRVAAAVKHVVPGDANFALVENLPFNGDAFFHQSRRG